ncbi:hypothetical protein [Nocardioides sp. B-3]|uniref:hypothetical protein n=1 Tax=Nocardioides sp. B-3 TaxID=2895565 RepID=UPI002152CE82|nr:hypothetical protein [Nocardioides sp. B-3]UUZ59252.1 hypothetical protein LP418_25820 [Nocardioides sp. B-3]
MDDETLAGALPSLLADVWGIDNLRARPLGGGMNSATALVETSDGARYVAKWSSDIESLQAGCSTAADLAAGGVRTGEPVPSEVGDLTTPLSEGALALLCHVPRSRADRRIGT